MVGTNAEPARARRKACNELILHDFLAERRHARGDGKVMQDQGITDVYLMAPNYAAGKDMINGFKRSYKGRIVDEVYTRLGQTDYQAELSQLRSKNPKAVFVFYPGGMGISFRGSIRRRDSRQFRCTRLYGGRDLDPGGEARCSGPVRDALLEPRLKNPANQKYVSDYRQEIR